MTELRDQVRERYAVAARSVDDGKAADDWSEEAGCCEPHQGLGVQLYDAAERDTLPDDAVLASLGCGNPTAVTDLHEGDAVLDLGSGGGIDVLLSAQRVGPNGRVFGVDMTDEMLDLARENARKAGATNVEFRRGFIEDIPIDSGTIDVVISNCVINLSTDKAKVIDEIARVLRPGGRLGISDVVADDDLSVADRAARGSFVGCIAGALSFSEYRTELARAGFEEIEIVATHKMTDGMHGAIVKAVKPA